MSHTINFLIRTPMFELYVVRCDSKNKYSKDRCSKEIGVHAQNMIASIINMILGGGVLFDHSMSTRIFTLIINKIFIGTPKIMKKVALALIWIY